MAWSAPSPDTRTERRTGPDQGPTRVDARSASQRDRDRIIYTRAFRRLAGITQTVPGQIGYSLHNRLTHVLEVAQVGRRLAERLVAGDQGKELANAVGGVDPDVVEAACLAHDLGHPPFGHTTEHVLDEILSSHGGFEGNAQTFRVVTRLSVRRLDIAGLDLTRATLNAILKYPWLRASPEQKKFGAYEEDSECFQWVRQHIPGEGARKTAEAALMDTADDIAYSVHDLEDFYMAGKIPLDRLEFTAESDRFWSHVERRRAAGDFKYDVSEARGIFGEFVSNCVQHFVRGPYLGDRKQRANLRTMTSNLVSRFINSVGLQVPSSQSDSFVTMPEKRRIEIALLKELTWCYVIDHDALATQQEGQRQLIQKLFQIYADAAKAKNRRLIPKSLHDQLDVCSSEGECNRLVADLIAGMSEEQAIFLAHRLAGTSLGPGLTMTVQ